MAVTASGTDPYAVSRITAVDGDVLRAARMTSIPLPSDIRMSVTTRS